MMFRNKKGADSTMGPMIWLIVILIVAALVIFFVAGGFGKIGDLFNQAPETLEGVIAVCNAIKTPATFCEQMREVELNGEVQWVNCFYPNIKDRLEITSEIECNIPDSYGIAGDDSDSWGRYFCAALVKKGDWQSGIKANGILCETQTCADIGGELIDTTLGKCTNTNEKAYTKGFEKVEGKSCCL